MGSEDPKDILKSELGWGPTSTTGADKEPNLQVSVKKRRRKKFRELPEYYFLTRRSWPKAIAYYGSYFALGIGTGMLIENWVMKKQQEDPLWSVPEDEKK